MRKPLQFWYLGIVDKNDAKKGEWHPTWILCKSTEMSDARSGYRVIRVGGGLDGMTRVLVTSQTGNELLIDFLSNYRTRDKMIGTASKRKTRKYYPEGFLCYFACDLTGQRTGPATLIKRVPDKSVGNVNEGYKRMKEALAAVPTIPQLFNRDDNFTDFPCPYVKRKFPQNGDAPVRMRKKPTVFYPGFLEKIAEIAREHIRKVNLKRRDLRLRKYRTRKDDINASV